TVSKPTVIQQPSGSDVYRGEKVTLRCEIYGGGGAQWTYEWRTTRRNSPTSSEYRINRVSWFDSGEYSCRAEGDHQITEWSDALTLTVRYKPQPVLSVSPSWLSPGASVTLSCGGLEHPSAGWRFFWYKVVPAKSSSSYSLELLTGRTNWTEQNSYLINGQNHTAGYVCRAGRGEPVFYTKYSEAKFVWSADAHPAASLSVTPDRVQHFINQSVTLSCRGNNTEWRLRRFTETGGLSDTHCSNWGTMTGSSCSINTGWSHSGVYWCESGSGDFSNAVNITVQDRNNSIIIGPIIGILVIILIILPLLLWCCIRSKDFCCIRSESSSQSPTTNHGVNQTDSQVYSSLLHGDTSEYESIQRATNKGIPDDLDEDPVYTNMKAETTGGS
ncbi:high affinity immunoglobulin gamma Fc receptor I-like, partial [Cyprinodon tularosa]|uniref:high affinity immunoglobulin gamma Fc receptor I-like n=1 Tax=Cyprinodon tularosa TaxID=77115 RepID=UPI0018E230D3